MTTTWIEAAPPPRRSRRRAVVFSCAFMLALAGGLIYVYSRPPEYRAMARLQIAPAGAVTQPTSAKDTPTIATDAKSFLTEVQVLTSRPLLEIVYGRLGERGPMPDLGPDPATTIQHMLQVDPVVGTQIVELSAVSRDQGLVAPLVNAVVDAYRQHVAEVYKGSAGSSYREINDEVGKLGDEVAAKRETINAFRARYDIVSMEHKENDVLAEIDRLSQSFTDAENRQGKAQARLQTLQNSVAAGKAVVRAKDDPTLADIEQRASALREQWHEVQRRFTPAYLAVDADAKSLQARLANLEEQLNTQRAASARAALLEAQEELAAAQSAAEKARQDVTDNQKQAREFATHLNEYKTLREDLDHLEEMHRGALDRLMKLQSSEQERAPRVELIEAATASAVPWWPDYRRDALIALAGSLVFGLFAAWFADFIGGQQVMPGIPTIMMQHAWLPPMLGRLAASEPLALNAPARAQLPRPPTLPRQLSDAEITALISAASEDAKIAALALLAGVAAGELAALRWSQIDLSSNAINLLGNGARTIPLEEPLLALLKTRQPGTSDTVLCTSAGAEMGKDQIERLVQYAAHDAGLDQPTEVTPDALWYTWLSYLLRQGIRAADVSRVAGEVPHDALLTLMEIHSPKVRQPLEVIDRVLPVLRELVHSGRG